MDLENTAIGGQLSDVFVEVVKASVIANHVDGQYSPWNGAGHNSHILNFQLVKFLVFLLF